MTGNDPLLQYGVQLSQQIAAQLYRQNAELDRLKLLEARRACWDLCDMAQLNRLDDAEFQVFSQWGEDGILEWLIQRIGDVTPSFVEFGASNYRESNTRFLLMNRNWRGFVMDGSADNMAQLRQEELFWRYNLTATAAFITQDNLAGLIRDAGFSGHIGVLSIDLDGNDYWLWEGLTDVEADIVICEYNAVFGDRWAITVPYEPSFQRLTAHHSGVYFGASIQAMIGLAERKGYRFVGTNSAGCNAFFVRAAHWPKLEGRIARIEAHPSQFRDARDEAGALLYAGGVARSRLIADLPVVVVPEERLVLIEQLGELHSPEWLSRMDGR